MDHPFLQSKGSEGYLAAVGCVKHRSSSGFNAQCSFLDTSGNTRPERGTDCGNTFLVVKTKQLPQPPRVTDENRDGVTDDQDPIIARHPGHPNLVIAGGASYTHAKDVPEIGLAIVDALNGKDTASFGWTKSPLQKGSENQPALRASHNFEDLERRASTSSQIQQWRESGSEYVI